MPIHSDSYKFLDNPVWHALQTVHKNFSLGTDEICRYRPGTLQILGCENPGKVDLNDLRQWIMEGEKLFMVGDLAAPAPGWTISRKLDCMQMVCESEENLIQEYTEEILPLMEDDRSEMLELINLVQPGYFHEDTPLLGSYFGIRKDNKLVAMAGERLRMTGFSEISAVVTHPSHTGKKYAQMLVSHVAKKIMNEHAVPFLHFVSTNARAGKVYELLGFEERKIITFWELIVEKR
ncbi:GNAT family N-acetyltransferase [Dyadobacter subterraneus]|uniref:GNAT family N-acetyltransferase n=1 Tax=Dyadobacter subterraneus TaxID=2773304 RepID=A0ABR9WEU1_9BACT|nr:GNAT family N-acetyltransferase [Dyadobacter subterraneus]MBE9463441.1 GNAT family N-acetyltransferase [Dyadobacter subterraneus]